MQALHIEDALINSASVPVYTVVNWDQVTTMELEHTLGHEPSPVEVTLRLADGNIVRPRRKIEGFPIPVVAKELKTFIHTRNHFNGYARFNDLEAYLQGKQGEETG